MNGSLRTGILVGLLFGLAALAPAVRADVFEFEDGEFDPADWDTTPIIAGIGGGETEWIRESAGGNPDAFAKEILICYAETHVALLFHRVGFSFDPSVDGLIGSIDYHEDAKLLEGEAEGMYSWPALFQGDLTYVASAFTIPETEWTPKDRTGMRAEDFWMIDENLAVHPESNPDFGPGGTTIEFGFVRSLPSEIDAVRVAGIDNWKFTVHTTEPIGFCGPGEVNRGCGARADVLFVNGESGGETRTIEVSLSTPLTASIVEPPAHVGDGRDTKACLYVWVGQPRASDIVSVPKNLGTMCFGPWVIATKTPKKVWNGIGFDEKLGPHTGPGDPPLIVEGTSLEFFAAPTGLGRTVTATFQGIVEDSCSVALPIRYSVTNGFVLRVTGP